MIEPGSAAGIVIVKHLLTFHKYFNYSSYVFQMYTQQCQRSGDADYRLIFICFSCYIPESCLLNSLGTIIPIGTTFP